MEEPHTPGAFARALDVVVVALLLAIIYLANVVLTFVALLVSMIMVPLGLAGCAGGTPWVSPLAWAMECMLAASSEPADAPLRT